MLDRLEREWEVVALLDQGLSNRQTAERLVIIRKTTSVHVEHNLGKLDLHSRWQVADGPPSTASVLPSRSLT